MLDRPAQSPPKIFDPRGIVDLDSRPLAKRKELLDGLRLGILDNSKWNANKLLRAAAEGLAAGAPLAGQQFDSGFRLDPAASGDVVSSLEANGVRLTQTCSDAFKCYVVYTPGNRQAVCIEPYTCVPSPFGMAERGADTGLRVLAPGESDQFTLTLAVESTS